MIVKRPKVSVIMPIYNGEAFLTQAINSILTQSFTNFEFIIINDASTDSTGQILADFAKKDSRIFVITNSTNLKIARSLNRGIEIAKGEYIARMDADDISLPHRLEKQVIFMDTHPEIGVSGTWMTIYGTQEVWAPPLFDDNIKANLFFESCLYHPTIIMQKKVINIADYDHEMLPAEDYNFWTKLAIHGDVKFANISEPLLEYRTCPQGTKQVYKLEQMVHANQVRKKLLAHIGLEPTKSEFDYHIALSYHEKAKDHDSLINCSKWLQKLQVANKKRQFVNSDILATECAERLKTYGDNLFFLNRLKNAIAPPQSLRRKVSLRIKNRIIGNNG